MCYEVCQNLCSSIGCTDINVCKLQEVYMSDELDKHLTH